jgi:long-chain acyl-CoA synthetase
MFLTDLVREAARRAPHAPAIVSAGRRSSWQDFAAEVARLAGALQAAGIRPGERVAVLAANSPELLAFQYAVMWSGALLVPLNTRLAPAELAWIAGDCEPAAFVHDARMQQAADAILAAARVPRRLALEAFVASAAQAEPVAPRPDALAGIFYTGGTTGCPKGVMLSHHAQLVQARNIMESMALDAGSVFLHAMPLFHVAGAASAHATARAGGANSFLPVFDPAAVYARIREDGVDSLALAPTMYAMLLDSPARDEATLKKVRTLCYGAAPITPALLERLLGAFPSARIQQYYGQTEVAGACLVLPAEAHVPGGPLNTAGHAMPGFQVRVVNGEIVVAGEALMQGYWRDPARTGEVIRDGWLHTGDVGVMEQNGYIAVVDRLKDMIVTGGENVYSLEVESAIAAHPAVAACAVVGLPDERWGEAVHAVVVLRPGAACVEAELLDFCRQRIARYKCPKSIAFRAEALPLSGVGKVQKNLLRASLAASQGKLVEINPNSVNQDGERSAHGPAGAAVPSKGGKS